MGMFLVAAVAIYFWWRGEGVTRSRKPETAPITEAKPEPVQPVRVAQQPATIAKDEPASVPMKPEPMPAKMELPVPAVQPPVAVVPDPFAQPAVLDALAGKTTANLKRVEAALDEAFTKGKWTQYGEWLRAGLATELKRITDFSQPQGYDRVLKNPIFYGALLQHTLLHRLPADARAYLTEDSGSRPFFT